MSREAAAEALAKRWNTRARENARYYIKSDLEQQTPEQFALSGEADVAAFVDPWLSHLTERSRALDIGCGIGRLTRPLARRFARADGVDISAEMIDRALAHDRDGLDVQFHLVDGTGTLPFTDRTFNLVFSYIVLQHVPTLELVSRYVAESMRVLEPGGLAILQLNTRRRPLRERLTVRVVPSDRMPLLRRKLKVKVDPHDHMGVTLTEAQCRKIAQRTGADVLQLGPLGEQYTWMVLQSPAAAELG